MVLALMITLAHQSLASMSSENYRIWLDTFDAGGGESNSKDFKVESNLSDFNSSLSQSANFKQTFAFSGIGNEPTVGFSVNEITGNQLIQTYKGDNGAITQTFSLDFGQLSPHLTRIANHTISAYTNSVEGYTIRVYGQPLHSQTYTLKGIGDLAKESQPGTEQFGLNLAKNQILNSGADPAGGIGQAAANYSQADKFAYSSGSIIAYATSFSYQTNYTVTAIVNIADDTPAGDYGTVLTYEFIPVF